MTQKASFLLLSEAETFHRPLNVTPALCLWLLTCQLVPSCISLSNEERSTSTDGLNL